MKKLFYLLLVIFCSSCFYGSFKGLTSGYKKEKEYLNIVFLDSIDNIEKLDLQIIYSLNGETLKKEISKHKNSLVYFWSINCYSENCHPLHAVQSYCDDNDMKLFVVLDYYDRELTSTFSEIKHPFFSIDHFYYKTNFTNKYKKRFLNDLVGFELNDSISWKRYYYFEEDEFKKVERTIVELSEMVLP